MAIDDLPPESDSFPDLTADDLELAYQRALDAFESADWALDEEAGEAGEESLTDNERSTEEFAGQPPAAVSDTESAGESFEPVPGTDAASFEVPNEPSPVSGHGIEEPVAELQPPQAVREPEESNAEQRNSVRRARIIEACLFVGGQPLSAKKLATLLEGNNDSSHIEPLIDELNQEYSAQSRPYEIRLGDGGYRLALKEEFDAIRSRVFGVGPRDIKLSQDVLEILALIAYQQPISPPAIEAAKPNSANLLRQLLRRELISLTRIDQSRNGVEYRTTPRFLQLFGLGQLSELPRPEDLSIR